MSATRQADHCGLFAVSGHPRAARLTYLGLYALQHRGQEAAGIVAIEPEQGTRVRKGPGLVNEALGEEDIRALKGDTAVGHVRYSTTGRTRAANIQPLTAHQQQGQTWSIAHNGNLTNYRTLKRRLQGEGTLFQSDSDSEALLHLLARSPRDQMDDRIDDALSQLEGAFALILQIGRKLYVAKDPRGIRPLALGRFPEGGVAVASESCAFDLVGAEFVREIEEGEVLCLEEGHVRKLRPLPEQPAAHDLFELVYFARPDSQLWGMSVELGRRKLGRQLAREEPADADVVIAVPDSGNSAALGYAQQANLPFELGLIRNHYVGRTFIQPTQRSRTFRARLKYNPVQKVLHDKRVVVVDDSIVRGVTARQLTRLLCEKGGVREVHFRVSSPPIRHPDFYGIDMPTYEELIAPGKTVEEMRQELGMDSLGFLSLQGLKQPLARAGPFHDACWTGQYPAPLVDYQNNLLDIQLPEPPQAERE